MYPDTGNTKDIGCTDLTDIPITASAAENENGLEYEKSGREENDFDDE